ncbi:MAG: type-F conjugative transfer system pilin assembly protein TrbC [Gammaproteobacteria bacterium]
MAKFRLCLLLPPLFLTLTPYQASAQERFSMEQDAVRLPTAEEMAQAQASVRDAMERITQGRRREQHGSGAAPNIEALPKPAATAPDIALLAEKHKDLGRIALPQTHRADLLVLVSLSMPREALERTVQQAERAGATLVFRGLKGDSMMKMGEELKAIIGDRNVSAVIHPPAFQQFAVTQVPAVVIARPEAGHVLDNGCSKAETFVKVTGDVSLDYALDYIERRSPTWAEVASDYRRRIIRGVD